MRTLLLIAALSALITAAPAGAAWREATPDAAALNVAPGRNAYGPSLAVLAGVPYVAWEESDGTNNEVRVKRLKAAGTGWEEVVGGASPINHASDRDAF